jgi:hypothetical protein
LDEILSTEETYVKNLEMLTEIYVEPLKNFLTKEIHEKVFNEIKIILGVNTKFLKDLTQVLKNSKEDELLAKLGNFFKISSQSFKLYV